MNQNCLIRSTNSHCKEKIQINQPGWPLPNISWVSTVSACAGGPLRDEPEWIEESGKPVWCDVTFAPYDNCKHFREMKMGNVLKKKSIFLLYCKRYSRYINITLFIYLFYCLEIWVFPSLFPVTNKLSTGSSNYTLSISETAATCDSAKDNEMRLHIGFHHSLKKKKKMECLGFRYSAVIKFRQ